MSDILKRKEEPKPELIKEKWGWKEVPKEPLGYYELEGIYRFRNARTGALAIAIGYSTCTRSKPRGKELQIFRNQAIRDALDKLEGWECIIEEIIHEVWLKW